MPDKQRFFVISDVPELERLMARKKTRITKAMDVQPTNAEAIVEDPSSPSGWCRYSKAAGRKPIACKYGSVGDMAFIKEPWMDWRGRIIYMADYVTRYSGENIGLGSLADVIRNVSDGGKWEPPMGMSSTKSRWLLEIKKLKAHHIRDVEEYECLAEGVAAEFEMSFFDFIERRQSPNESFRLGFKHDWDRRILQNGRGLKFDANPWVWGIDIEVKKGPTVADQENAVAEVLNDLRAVSAN